MQGKLLNAGVRRVGGARPLHHLDPTQRHDLGPVVDVVVADAVQRRAPLLLHPGGTHVRAHPRDHRLDPAKPRDLDSFGGGLEAAGVQRLPPRLLHPRGANVLLHQAQNLMASILNGAARRVSSSRLLHRLHHQSVGAELAQRPALRHAGEHGLDPEELRDLDLGLGVADAQVAQSLAPRLLHSQGARVRAHPHDHGLDPEEL
mmetsp:Transcript_37263/g.84840  ORF Transcript_37263/g.84840 Transcript_37263/m.84840 type:complete len:203 (+) Transcript_37263:209-817(+)